MSVRFIDPGCLDELQVVEERNDVVQNGERHERVMACRSSAEEQVELAKEAGERRDACQPKKPARGGMPAKLNIEIARAMARLGFCFESPRSDWNVSSR